MSNNTFKEQLAALYDFALVAEQAHLHYVLVGAGARVLILDTKYDQIIGRYTEDWDLGILVTSWDAFENAKAAFLVSPDSKFKPGRIEHRLRHVATNIPFDILPFGQIAAQNDTIRWPKDETVMSVAGFLEAYEHSEIFPIQDKEIRVASEPGLAMLKIFAYNDRKRRDDITDLFFIFNNYMQDDKLGEAYSIATDELIDATVSFEDLGAYCLGVKLGKILRLNTYAKLAPLLLAISDPYSIAISTAIINIGDEAQQETDRKALSRKVQTFHAGIQKGMLQ